MLLQLFSSLLTDFKGITDISIIFPWTKNSTYALDSEEFDLRFDLFILKHYGDLLKQ